MTQNKGLSYVLGALKKENIMEGSKNTGRLSEGGIWAET